jgi:hypothetical protein
VSARRAPAPPPIAAPTPAERPPEAVFIAARLIARAAAYRHVRAMQAAAGAARE